MIKINSKMKKTGSEASWRGGAGRHGPPNLVKWLDFSEILMLHRKLFRLKPLVKTKVLKFIGKSFELVPHPSSTGATTPLNRIIYQGITKAKEKEFGEKKNLLEYAILKIDCNEVVICIMMHVQDDT